MNSYVILFFAFIATAASIVRQAQKSREMLEHWAAGQDMQIIHREYRWLFRGPFWLSSNSQSVYYVRLRDRQGRIHTAWVCCGSRLLSMLSGHVQVRWVKK